jgi:hypothetical protein
MSDGAIGGYFGLELQRTKFDAYASAFCFQSGRAAFLALIKVSRPKRVWMPYYLCDSMYAPLRRVGIPCAQYSINERFEIASDFELREGDWLYYVNYFGLCDNQAQVILNHYGPANVVLDHCQAFFSPPRNCVATIYSPRKFFGVPDGGLLVTSQPVVLPAAVDHGSKQRADYLVARVAEGAEAGYGSYQRAEQSLEELEPLRMSDFTKRVLASIEFDTAKVARNENFLALHEQLGRWNKFPIDLARIDGPLCYPLIVELPGLRERLIASRVFVATYWKDVLRMAPTGSHEEYLVANLFPLPCDQRYGKEEMMQVASVCVELIQRQANIQIRNNS